MALGGYIFNGSLSSSDNVDWVCQTVASWATRDLTFVGAPLLSRYSAVLVPAKKEPRWHRGPFARMWFTGWVLLKRDFTMSPGRNPSSRYKTTDPMDPHPSPPTPFHYTTTSQTKRSVLLKWLVLTGLSPLILADIIATEKMALYHLPLDQLYHHHQDHHRPRHQPQHRPRHRPRNHPHQCQRDSHQWSYHLVRQCWDPVQNLEYLSNAVEACLT